MERDPSIAITEAEEPSPFWTKVAAPWPGCEEGDRVAILDVYEPTYVPADGETEPTAACDPSCDTLVVPISYDNENRLGELKCQHLGRAFLA